MSEKVLRNIFVVGTVLFLAILGIMTVDSLTQVVSARTAQLTDQVVAGKQVWQSKNCNDCHTILGIGGYYAPELTKTFNRRGAAWLKAFLKNPGKVLPGTTMPNQNLSDTQADNLVAFFQWVSLVDTNGWPPQPLNAPKAPAPAVPAAPVAPPAGNAAPAAPAVPPVSSAPAASTGNTNSVPPAPANAGLPPAQPVAPVAPPVVSTPAPVAPPVASTPALSGAVVFQEKGCAMCHVLNGQGGRSGPDLSHIASQPYDGLPNTPDFLSKYLAGPQAQNPNALMPAIPMTDAERDALVQYLSSLK